MGFDEYIPAARSKSFLGPKPTIVQLRPPSQSNLEASPTALGALPAASPPTFGSLLPRACLALGGSLPVSTTSKPQPPDYPAPLTAEDLSVLQARQRHLAAETGINRRGDPVSGPAGLMAMGSPATAEVFSSVARPRRALSQVPPRWVQGPPPPLKSDTPPPGFLLKAVREPVKQKVTRRRTSSGTARSGAASGRSESSTGAVGMQDVPAHSPPSPTRSAKQLQAQPSWPSPRMSRSRANDERANVRLGERLQGERRSRTGSRGASRTSTVQSPRNGGRPATAVGNEPPSPSANRGCVSPHRPGSRSRRPTTAGDEATSAGKDVPSLLSCGWAVFLASSRLQRKKAPKRSIKLLRSVFAGRPPVLFFDYAHCNVERLDSGRVLSDEELNREGFDNIPKMFFCHEKTRDVHEYNAVMNTLRNAGLYRTTSNSGKWSLFWGTHPSPEQLRMFHPFQKANHFPASWHLGRKDLLWKNVYRMRRQWPQEFNIMPVSYVLPEEFSAWVSAREQSPNALWIYKPANLSCGRGIKLLTSKPSQATDKQMAQKTAGVIQRYVDRPLLINGYKFDLRVYVVVTSFDPLKIYLNREGLVRIATERYAAPSADNLDHRTMHLTNYSVNKHSESYVKNLDGSPGGAAAKAAARNSPVGGAESGEEDGLDLDLDMAKTGGPEARGVEEGEEDEEGEELDDDGRGSPTNAQPADASKWSFGQLHEYCNKNDLDYELMMTRIKDLIIKTVLAAEPAIVNMWHQGANYSTSGASPGPQIGPHQTCFEIYGFDVMLDDRLKPWLLEVNTFPSLSSSSPFDKRVKTMLVADALTLAGFNPFDHELVDRAVKDDNLKRLQGLHQRSPLVSRSHTLSSVSTAPLRTLGEAEWQLIVDSQDEYMRRGLLEQIYPTREATQRYAPYFPTPRYSNLVLARWLHEVGSDRGFEDARREMPPWVPRTITCDAC